MWLCYSRLLKNSKNARKAKKGKGKRVCVCLLGSVIESDNRDFEREKKAWSDEFGMEGDKHRDKLVFYRFCGNKKK